MARITALEISRFRGIVEAAIRLDGHSLVIHGENGSGKSSVVNALSFFYKGTLPGFEGTQGLSLSKHTHHVNSKPGDARVQIQFVGCHDPLCRTLSAAPAPSDGLCEHLEVGKQCHFILRRADLLDFIEADPRDRFNAIAGLIGIEELDPVDLLWQKMSREYGQSAQTASTNTGTKQRELCGLLGGAENDKDQLDFVADRLQAFGVDRPSSWSNLSALRAKVAQQATPADAVTKAKDLRQLVTICAEVRSLRKDAASITQLRTKLDQLREQMTTESDLEHLSLLRQADNFIVSYPTAECPICGTDLGEEELRLRVQQKKQALLLVSGIADDLRKLKAEKQSHWEGIRSRLLDAQRAWTMHFPQEPDLFDPFLIACDSAIRQLLPSADLLAIDSILGFSDVLVSTDFDTQITGAVKMAKQAETQCGLSERGTQAADLIGLIDGVSRLRRDVTEARKAQEKTERLCAKVKAVADAFTRVKREEVQAVFNQLESRVAFYYTSIHKDEPTSGHRLDLPEDKRASLYIRSQFHDIKDVDPRAYHSEGHLDSLGLAIFLAFAEQFNTGFPLLILDDVVATMDAQHMERICQLIMDHMGDKQLIITSHDRWWTQRLREWVNRKGKSQQFRFIELYDWTVELGPKLNDYVPLLDQVFSLLDRNQREAAAALSRHCLEWLLNELTISLAVPVPRRRFPSYELGVLMPPFFSHVKKHIKQPVLENEALFAAFEPIATASNPLTHYNEWAMNAPKSVVRDFAENINALQDLFYCDVCGEFVAHKQEARKVSCRRGCKSWDYT